MSTNRENVIWQSKDGTWTQAFYAYYDVPPEDGEEFDYEWDVEYYDYFNYVSSGHRTSEAAYNAWDGSNPGGTTTYAYVPNNVAAIAEFENKAWRFNNPEEAAKKDARALRAVVKKSITEQGLRAGNRVEVLFSTDGFSGVSYTGNLHVKAGWLGFTSDGKFMRVINVATGAPAPKIGRITKIIDRTRGEYGYGYSGGW